MARPRDSIVVAGALARRVGVGGHAWVLLQWLLGLRELGYEVTFVDELEPGALTDARGTPCAAPRSMQWRWMQSVLDAHGLRGAYALVVDGTCLGMDRDELGARVARSSCLLNVMGYLRDEDLLAEAARRVYVDIDPGFPQMWCALGLHDPFPGHDAFVTVGSRIGSPECIVPTCGREWVTTPPPVALSYWPAIANAPRRERITTVATWRGPDGPVEYDGVVYGTRVHEFRRFFDLPDRAGGHFELALAIDGAEERDIGALASHGWRIVDPRRVAGDPHSYRRYVQSSAMELMVAKSMYARSVNGWLSDRSACYLASGRPVVAQDTGLGGVLPIGQGFLTFSTADEAVDAIAEVRGDYAFHSKAARETAAEVLDARVVVDSVLSRLGVR
jgi:hypothetical protein